MDENNNKNQQLNNQNDSNNNNVNNLQEEYGEVEEKKSSRKYNFLIFIFIIDFYNISLDNDSQQFHEFENKAFNFSKLREEVGEIKEIQNELSSSKYIFI